MGWGIGLVMLPLWLLLGALVFTVAVPLRVSHRVAWRLGLIDRRKCSGWEDPEERCPYSPENCICYIGRERPAASKDT